MRFLVRGRAPEAAKISGLDREPPKNAVHPDRQFGACPLASGESGIEVLEASPQESHSQQ